MWYINIAKTQQKGDEHMNKYPELNVLKGKIREKGETYRSMSEKTGIPLNTFSNKLNGYSLFDITEVISICSVLDIPPEQIPYFFTKNVA